MAAKRFDVIGAGLFINHSRCQVIGFSNPVIRSGGALIPRPWRHLRQVAPHHIAASLAFYAAAAG
nr:hypothetical protein [Sodalis sp. dw_96]